MREIAVDELASWREEGKEFLLLDVREHDEVQTAFIPGARHIRMGEVPGRISELPKDKEIVVMCHHGGRSERVVAFLETQGFPDAINLKGGINEWSVKIDPAVPRY